MYTTLAESIFKMSPLKDIFLIKKINSLKKMKFFAQLRIRTTKVFQRLLIIFLINRSKKATRLRFYF